MRVYAVGIAADNKGKVLVTEPPSSAQLRHRPQLDKPSVWDFAGDGYPIYRRTGGLADIIVAHLLVVRDKSGQRNAGEIVKQVSESPAANDVISNASRSLSSLGGGGLAAASALGLILPIANVVGEIISKTKDVVLQTISGSMFLDAQRKEQDHFSQTIKAPDDNMDVEADVFLFDAETESDSIADTKTAETQLKAQGLLFTAGN